MALECTLQAGVYTPSGYGSAGDTRVIAPCMVTMPHTLLLCAMVCLILTRVNMALVMWNFMKTSSNGSIFRITGPLCG